MLTVSEIFGPTMQGEGAMAGVFTYFVRFGACDYRCLFCDTAFAVLPELVREESTKMGATEIVDKLLELPKGPRWITLSGGNPALQKVDDLLDEVRRRTKYRIAVETQGSVWKDWLSRVDQLTISPKPPSSGMDGILHPEVRHYLEHGMLNGQVNLKVPVFDDRDYEFAVKVHQQWPLVPFYFSIVTRMGGLHGDFDGGAIDTPGDLAGRYRWLVERASHDERVWDVRAFPQLHVVIWGHKRGV